MTARDRRGRLRIATREEFKAEFDRVLTSGALSDRRSLGVLINPLLGFSIDTRPVYWRVLAVQYHIYLGIVGREASRTPFESEIQRLGEQYAKSLSAGS